MTNKHTHKLVGVVEKEVDIEGGPFARGQLRSYMRAPVAYYTAQLLSQTGNIYIYISNTHIHHMLFKEKRERL